MKLMTWGDATMVDIECPNCTQGGSMSNLGVFNLPMARNERTGEQTSERHVIPGRDVTMLKCQHCGFIALFDTKTLERVEK